MADVLSVTVGNDGELRFIYSDQLAGLLEHGAARVERASHVEPYTNALTHETGWIADMRPSGGPVLFANGEAVGAMLDAGMPGSFARPFTLRQQALDAEVAWLRANRGL